MKTIQQTLTSILLICLVTFSAFRANTQITTTSQWTWVSGDNSTNQNGVYGTKGTAAASNKPGARCSSISWTDASGNVWLFGGDGYAASGSRSYLNDLWKYNSSTGQWTWVSGDNTTNQLGVYGTQGTAAASNKPGARTGSVSWTDASGNVWLFGGQGYAASGGSGSLNDLWKYNTSTGQWTWVSGDNTINQFGVYGTKGTAAASNKPGARNGSVSWTDASGNIWLFGGQGYAASGGSGSLNDLWKYNTSTVQWTWVSGDKTTNQVGVYGTQGTAAASNKPGARGYSVSWTDASGNVWLFGGIGYAASGGFGGFGHLNDLWKYNTSSGQWTWVSGDNTINQLGVYGTKGTAAAINKPGARRYSISWTDASSNLWLFEGFGYDASGSASYLNDLWKYNTSTGQWTWVSGDNTIDQYGVYGTQGTTAASNKPGARYQSVSWTDAGGNLWLFGGQGYAASGVAGNLNDLWKLGTSCTATTSTFTTSACVSYTWAAKGNKVYTTSNNTDTIKLVNAAGCDSIVTLNLTINSATTSSNTASVCSNQLPYSWNGLTFSVAGTKTAHLTNSKGCDSAVSLTVSIVTSSTPSVSITSSANNVCSNVDVTFTATATNEGIAPVYQWIKNGVNVGSGSSITFLGGTINNNDSVWCVLTSNSACATSPTATSSKIKMIIKTTPVVSPVKSNTGAFITNLTMCTISGQSTLYNTYLGGTWSSSNSAVATAVNGVAVGGVSSSGLLTAVANGTTEITYSLVTASTGCGASASLTVFVDAVPTLNAIAGGSNGVCIGSNIALSNNSIVPAGGSAVWSSLAGRATVDAASGVLTGVNAGVASIKYAITNANGCSNSTTSSITVNSFPSVPSIGYAVGTVNPQTGPAGAFCNNRTFTLLGSPTGGVWSTTNASVVTVTIAGLTKTLGVGTGSVVYTYTNAGGCSSSRSVIGTVAACVPRGVNGGKNEKQETRNEFTMYPNPARSFISLNVNTLIGSGTIVISDLYGKQVKVQSLSMGTNTIDVSSFAKGIYLVSMITKEGKTTKKLVVE